MKANKIIMNKENNFEDVFKNAFEGFEGEPSKDVWNTIAKDREMKQNLGLVEQTPESVFSKVFNNFTSNPSSGVWFGVKDFLIKKMFYRRLKYFLFFLLFVGGIATLYFNIDSSPVKNSSTPKNNKKGLVENKKTIEIPFDKITSTNTPSIISTNTYKQVPTEGNAKVQNISLNKTNNSKYNNSNDLNFTLKANSLNVNSLNVNKEQSSDNEVLIQDNLELTKDEKILTIDSANLIPVKNDGVTQSSKTKSLKNSEQNKNNKKVNNYVKYTKETDINNEESKFKIGIMSGIDYGNFTLKGGNEIYKDVRKNQELFRPTSFHSGITFSYMINEHWYIQANGVFANQAMNVAYNKKIVKPDTTRDALGNITKIENKVLFNVDTNTHYAFSTFEIPLMIGYRFGDKRWTFHAMAGPEWSLILSKRGGMLSASSMKVESIENNNIPTVKQIWGMWLAMGGSYQMSHQYSITVEPIFRYKFNSIFNSTYPVKQYNYATGINLGIRYHFN